MHVCRGLAWQKSTGASAVGKVVYTKDFIVLALDCSFANVGEHFAELGDVRRILRMEWGLMMYSFWIYDVGLSVQNGDAEGSAL